MCILNTSCAQQISMLATMEVKFPLFCSLRSCTSIHYPHCLISPIVKWKSWFLKNKSEKWNEILCFGAENQQKPMEEFMLLPTFIFWAQKCFPATQFFLEVPDALCDGVVRVPEGDFWDLGLYSYRATKLLGYFGLVAVFLLDSPALWWGRTEPCMPPSLGHKCTKSMKAWNPMNK